MKYTEDAIKHREIRNQPIEVRFKALDSSESRGGRGELDRRQIDPTTSSAHGPPAGIGGYRRLQDNLCQVILCPVDGPVIAPSAYRHDIGEAQILHALRNPLSVHDEDDLTMVVGADPTGLPLEIGYVESDDGHIVVVHAMRARDRFLQRRRPTD